MRKSMSKIAQLLMSARLELREKVASRAPLTQQKTDFEAQVGGRLMSRDADYFSES